MTVLTVRNLPDEVHRALRTRAARHQRSMEAEARAILELAVKPPDRTKLGSLLTDIGKRAKLSDDEFALFETVRDRTPTKPLSFK